MSQNKMDKTALILINETSLSVLVSEEELLKVVSHIEAEEKSSFIAIEYAFVDEDKIVQINKEYLSKDYVTDIITFRVDDIREDAPFTAIEGSICICLSRVFEQAVEFESMEKQELMRVCIHGLLHLSGHEDGSEEDKKRMREKENYYLEKMNLL
jgi:rRNA maturation RNase YbeY